MDERYHGIIRSKFRFTVTKNLNVFAEMSPCWSETYLEILVYRAGSCYDLNLRLSGAKQLVLQNTCLAVCTSVRTIPALNGLQCFE